MMAERSPDAPGWIRPWLSLRGFFLSAAVIVVLDQLTKWLAVVGLAEGRVVVIVPRVLQFIYRTNTGAAWSMFSDRTGLLTIFATAVAIGLTIWSLRLRSAELVLRLPLSLILGGAVGNLIDRYRLGYVIDFIDAHWDAVYHFPTFNVADSAICVGMALLIWMNLRIPSEAPESNSRNGTG
jgi:signal peptidase II